MNYMRYVLLVGLMTCLAGISSFAQTDSVPEKATIPDKPAVPEVSRSSGKIARLGDPAPPVTVMQWVKGAPVNFKSGTNIYVLVFCTLSRANAFAITNLNSLQKRYQDKGVVVVAISDDSPEQLTNFVQIKGAEINFTVAADDVPGRTVRNYQQAFQLTQLPLAYIVGKDGNVLWHGHPLTGGLGLVVDEIASGRYDLQHVQRSIIASEQMEQYLALARQDITNNAMAGRMLLTIRTNDVAGLCDLAFKIATDPFIEKRDVALANAALDRAEQLTMTNATEIAVDRAILLFQTGKEAEGLAKARQALASAQTKEDRDVAQANLHAMEVRLAAARTNQIAAPADKP